MLSLSLAARARVDLSLSLPLRMALSLTAARSRLYAYTRPAFAVIGFSTAAAFDTYAPPREPSSHDAEQRRDRLMALPLLGVGVAGVAAVARGYSGARWLAHSYERYAWAIAYGGLSVAAGETLLGVTQRADPSVVCAPSAGAALAAIAGERLGSPVGRLLLPALTLTGLFSAGAAMNGDARGERVAQALQVSALALMPTMQLACLPVYTLSVQGALAGAWLWMAAAAHAFNSTPPLASSPEAATQLLLAVGGASFLRTLLARVPICKF